MLKSKVTTQNITCHYMVYFPFIYTLDIVCIYSSWTVGVQHLSAEFGPPGWWVESTPWKLTNALIC